MPLAEDLQRLGRVIRDPKAPPEILVVHPSIDKVHELNKSAFVRAVTPGTNIAGQRFELIMVYPLSLTERNIDWLRGLETRLVSETSRMIML